MADAGKALTLADLDVRLREVEAVQDLILRILSITKPLDKVLEHYGATETQERAFYRLLDDVTARAKGEEANRPTFGYFQMQLDEIFPGLRHNREFIRLIVETLKLDRPAYRELHRYTVANGWAAWS